MKASDWRDRATDRSPGSAYADGPVQYVLFEARGGPSERIIHETDMSSGRTGANVKKVDRHQRTVRFSVARVA